MRLLNVHTMRLEEFVDADSAPRYAILSHTWGRPDEEISFLDLATWSKESPPPLASSKMKGWAKMEGACHQTKLYEALVPYGASPGEPLDYVWIDTCCIDKSSSAELQEAINSMFQWYARSEVCFAYLEDVCSPGKVKVTVDLETSDGEANIKGDSNSDTASGSLSDPGVPHFTNARWFTRGWTLQELIAPRKLIFFDQAWHSLGTKHIFSWDISHATNIPPYCLCADSPTNLRQSLDSCSVAKRLRWASRRRTTRKEDRAYSLLGIFDIYMPLLYGEGERAFIRLQEEIMKVSDDASLLVWDEEAVVAKGSADGAGADAHQHSLILAPNPGCFSYSQDLIGPSYVAGVSMINPSFSMNQRGLAITLPVLFDQANPRNLYAMVGIRGPLPAESDWTDVMIAAIPLYSPADLDNTGSLILSGAHLEVLRTPLSRLAIVSSKVLRQAQTRQLLMLRRPPRRIQGHSPAIYKLPFRLINRNASKRDLRIHRMRPPQLTGEWLLSYCSHPPTSGERMLELHDKGVQMIQMQVHPPTSNSPSESVWVLLVMLYNSDIPLSNWEGDHTKVVHTRWYRAYQTQHDFSLELFSCAVSWDHGEPQLLMDIDSVAERSCGLVRGLARMPVAAEGLWSFDLGGFSLVIQEELRRDVWPHPVDISIRLSTTAESDLDPLPRVLEQWEQYSDGVL